MKYRTIVADPPWEIGEFPPNFGYERGRVTPYPCMTVDAIKALPVRSLVNNRDEDAHLYLWTTNEFLFAAKEVAEAWGFTYVATLVWCKPPMGLGLGGRFTSNLEFILYCRKAGFASIDKREPRPDIAAVTERIGEIVTAAGYTTRDMNEWVGMTSIASWWTSRLPKYCAVPKPGHWEILKRHVPTLAELDETVAALNAAKGTNRKPPRPLENRIDTRWFTWPRGKHSEKPEAFLDLVERVSPDPYLELFARRNRLGWDTWGNESLEHVTMEGEASVSTA